MEDFLPGAMSQAGVSLLLGITLDTRHLPQMADPWGLERRKDLHLYIFFK